jgi:hypothetical protein
LRENLKHGKELLIIANDFRLCYLSIFSVNSVGFDMTFFRKQILQIFTENTTRNIREVHYEANLLISEPKKIRPDMHSLNSSKISSNLALLTFFAINLNQPTLQGVRTKEPNVVSSSDDEEDLDNDSDDDYSGQEDNIDADYCCDDDNSDDQGNGDDKSNDDYSCNNDNDDDGDIDNDGDGDDDDDGDIDNDCDDDGGTDNLCAICDNGGKLLR